MEPNETRELLERLYAACHAGSPETRELLTDTLAYIAKLEHHYAELMKLTNKLLDREHERQ